MMKKYTPYTTIPEFGTDVLGTKCRVVGSIDTFEHAITEGNVDEMNFITYYINQQDEVTGVLTVGREPVAT